MKADYSDDVVQIRPYNLKDVDALYEAVLESQKDLAVWLPWAHENYARQESLDWVTARREAWEQKTDFQFSVRSAETGQFLGGVGINRIEWSHKFANLGYWVRSSCTGKGIATRAAKLCAQFALDELGFNRIEMMVSTNNDPSQRVAEKAGATNEGILRKRWVIHGESHDICMYSILREN